MGFIGALIGMEFAETDARLRQRLQLQLRHCRSCRRSIDRLRHAGLGALGQWPPRVVPRHFSHVRGVRDRRRPAAGEELVTLSDTEKDADGLPALRSPMRRTRTTCA